MCSTSLQVSISCPDSIEYISLKRTSTSLQATTLILYLLPVAEVTSITTYPGGEFVQFNASASTYYINTAASYISFEFEHSSFAQISYKGNVYENNSMLFPLSSAAALQLPFDLSNTSDSQCQPIQTYTYYVNQGELLLKLYSPLDSFHFKSLHRSHLHSWHL
jgi:hypothetical protein